MSEGSQISYTIWIMKIIEVKNAKKKIRFSFSDVEDCSDSQTNKVVQINKMILKILQIIRNVENREKCQK